MCRRVQPARLRKGRTLPGPSSAHKRSRSAQHRKEAPPTPARKWPDTKNVVRTYRAGVLTAATLSMIVGPRWFDTDFLLPLTLFLRHESSGHWKRWARARA